jgi:hypothetical protein
MQEQQIPDVQSGVASALACAGYDIDEFEIQAAPAPLSAEMGLGDELLVVRRRRTGHERFYLKGPSTCWLGLLVADAMGRKFGDRRGRPRH